MRSHSRRWMWIIVILGILAAAGGWYYFHGTSGNDKSKGAGGAPVPVGAATARTGNINIYLSALGAVTPRNTVTVHTRVNGELMKVNFEEGQMVKRGDMLAEIDPRPYQAALEQAQGQLIRDQALLKEARIDLKRYQILYAQDSIAKQQLDTQASLVRQYQGDVKNDAGLVDAAKVNLIYTRITAPVSGRVGLRQVDPGNIVQATDTNGIVIVTQLQPMTVLFTIPEDNIPETLQRAQGGTKLTAEAWDRAGKNKLATGTLIAIDNEVDPTTGTVKFRAEFSNKNNALFPSQFVNVKLKLETRKGVVLIPSAAVQRGANGSFVYRVKPDNTVAVQEVTLGAAEGDNISVEKGLAVDDKVVIDGGDSLRDGAQIEIAALDGKPVAAQTNKDKTAAGDTQSGSDAKEKTHKHKHSDDAGK